MLLGVLPRFAVRESGSGTHPRFAITIDDGPDPGFTPAILQVLRESRTPATFFLEGAQAKRYPELVQAILSEGHEVGSHTYSHADLSATKFGAAMREVKRTKVELERFTDRRCTLFRPPYGKLTMNSLVVPWLYGQRVILWTVDLKDYEAVSAQAITSALDQRPLRPGDIVLYHGYTQAGLEALPTVIDAGRRNGLEPVTVSVLAASNAAGS